MFSGEEEEKEKKEKKKIKRRRRRRRNATFCDPQPLQLTVLSLYPYST